jgi:hypothetical protein
MSERCYCVSGRPLARTLRAWSVCRSRLALAVCASYTLRQPPPDTAVEEQLRMLREDIAVGLSDILAELCARCNPLPTEPHYQVISQPISPASNTSTGTSDTAFWTQI